MTINRWHGYHSQSWVVCFCFIPQQNDESHFLVIKYHHHYSYHYCHYQISPLHHYYSYHYIFRITIIIITRLLSLLSLFSNS